MPRRESVAGYIMVAVARALELCRGNLGGFDFLWFHGFFFDSGCIRRTCLAHGFLALGLILQGRSSVVTRLGPYRHSGTLDVVGRSIARTSCSHGRQGLVHWSVPTTFICASLRTISKSTKSTSSPRHERKPLQMKSCL